MTAILGISGLYHDSAAALVIDGDIVAAAQEERFSRVKHDERFPRQAIDYCLAEAGIAPGDLDYVGFYEKPITKFDRLLETYLAYVPAGYRSFRKALPVWLGEKLHLPRKIATGLRMQYQGPCIFTEHHESHAASAFFPSPFSEAAILTLDGVGEWATTCIGVGQGNKIELIEEMRFPHSLGLLYSAFTYYAGFRVNSGEYKLMGLAPYGRPVYEERLLKNVLDMKEDGSFRLDMAYFNYCAGLTMTSSKFHKLFGGPPRRPESPITQREMDLAASVQAVTERIMLRIARYAHRKTGLAQLTLAGGVALNCVSNGRLLREGPFEKIWIQPAAGDAGGALGTALFIWHQLLERPRDSEVTSDRQRGSLLGPSFDDDEIADILQEQNASYTTCDSDEEMCEVVSELLAKQLVVGWFQGRMEFGPRALGARSILGDPRSPKMRSVMNRKIKFRESFRPFAPAVLREHVSDYFEVSKEEDSPYMLIVAPVREEIRTPVEASTKIQDLEDPPCRSTIPAVTHVDYSARVQTVDLLPNPLLHRLLRSFHRKTGCPLLINTSFNVRGEPIVCNPTDAYRCFLVADLDALVIGRHVLLKAEQSRTVSDEDKTRHLAQFQLD